MFVLSLQPEVKIQVEIDKHGSLYFLLNAFIGAYNRRTEAMERQKESADLDQLKTQIDSADAELTKEKK